MPKMPIDTPQRKIGSKACAIVHYTLNADHWLYREETNIDIGRDCVLELSINDRWNNDKIEGQIKGTQKLKELVAGSISFSIDTKTINYAISSGNSFVLFLVDVYTEEVYYVALQEYYIANGIPSKKLETQETISIHISKDHCLNNGDDDLQEVAKSRYSFTPPEHLIKTR